jgi:hypothetical protein
MKSSNVKVGKIPVTTSSRNTCPESCPFQKNGCYADSGPLSLHWNKVSEGDKRSISFDEFIKAIESIPEGQLWRHNQAGDLVGEGESIDGGCLEKLISANRGKKGYTYTHKVNDERNFKLIKKSNDEGFTINLSANSLDHADSLKELNVGPVVVVLPYDETNNVMTPKGNKVILCPATQKDGVSCSSCKLCQKANRSVIVGFPSHGVHKKKMSELVK